MMDEQWMVTAEDVQYAEYLAYTGLSAAPTMGATVHNQYDRSYPHPLSATAPDYYPNSLNPFASYLPYMTFVDGQTETEDTITNEHVLGLAPARMAQRAQDDMHKDNSDDEADYDGDDHIMQELL